MNCTDSSLKLDFSQISHAHPLQINSHKYKKMIEEITIKFDTELKQTKASWKSQLYTPSFIMLSIGNTRTSNSLYNVEVICWHI